MTDRDLPRRPSWEHLRNEARALQRRVRAGEVELAEVADPRAFRLSDAQRVLARGYGHASWARLKRYVEAVNAYARDPHEVAAGEDEAGEFLRLACLVYGADDLSRPARAAELLARDPSLAGRSIWTAAAAGDAQAAARVLAADPSAAGAVGGPFGWEPLLYVAYSRVRGEHVAVARQLLAAGADPNAGYLWDGAYLFTALTGAFGYGEDAPNQPPHPQSRALAELLLEAGADPNDDQTIYNRHFRTDDEHLEVLLAHGLGGARRGPWPARLGAHLAEPPRLPEDALVFVADNDAYSARVELLLRHGADPDGRGTQHPAQRGRRPIELAREHGAVRNEALLRAAGAAAPETDAVDDLIAACMRGERAPADPRTAAEAVRRHPRALIDAAERDNAAGVELLAAIGYDVNRIDGAGAALHIAAYCGHRRVCELLLDLGADPLLRDREFDAPAAGWARHAHHDELADWLER